MQKPVRAATLLMETRLLLLLSIALSLPACTIFNIDLSHQTLSQRIAMHDGPWHQVTSDFDECADMPAFMKSGASLTLEQDKENPEVDGGFYALAGAKRIPLTAISDHFKPLPPHEESSPHEPASQCLPYAESPVADIHDCIAEGQVRHQTLVGTYGNLCLLLTVYGHGNDIDKDAVLLVPWPGHGPIGPGVVVGGPRPMSRAPVTQPLVSRSQAR